MTALQMRTQHLRRAITGPYQTVDLVDDVRIQEHTDVPKGCTFSSSYPFQYLMTMSTAPGARVQVAKAGSGPISTGAAVLGGDLLFVASAASDSLLLHSPRPSAEVCSIA